MSEKLMAYGIACIVGVLIGGLAVELGIEQTERGKIIEHLDRIECEMSGGLCPHHTLTDSLIYGASSFSRVIEEPTAYGDSLFQWDPYGYFCRPPFCPEPTP